MKNSNLRAGATRSGPEKKKPKTNTDRNTDLYRVKVRCHVCGKEFLARYNVGPRAKVCTSPTHKCRPIKKGSHRTTCRENCCRSKYKRSASVQAMDTAIDSSQRLTDPEFTKFMKSTFTLPDKYGRPIRLIATTGCRIGEVFLVYIKDLRLAEKIPSINIPTLKRARGGRPVRTVHFHDKGMVSELNRAFRKGSPEEPLVVTSKRSLQRKIEGILEALGLRSEKKGCAHILRHTRASQLIAAGYDWAYVRGQLGWESLEMAKRYVHADADEIMKLGKKLPKVVYQ